MRKSFSVAISFVTMVGLSAPAYSQAANEQASVYTQSQTCACTTAFHQLSPENPAGQVVRAKGDVAVSGPSSYTPVKAGTPLYVNSEVIANNGTAELQVGETCHVSMPKNSVVNIQDVGGGNLCVNQSTAGDTASTAGSAGGLTQKQWLALGVAGVVGTVIAIGASNNGSDNNNRRRRPVSR